MNRKRPEIWNKYLSNDVEWCWMLYNHAKMFEEPAKWRQKGFESVRTCRDCHESSPNLIASIGRSPQAQTFWVADKNFKPQRGRHKNGACAVKCYWRCQAQMKVAQDDNDVKERRLGSIGHWSRSLRDGSDKRTQGKTDSQWLDWLPNKSVRKLLPS